MVGTWMLCSNGWGLAGRYHGWDMGALREPAGSGWSRGGRGRRHGWDMDALGLNGSVLRRNGWFEG